MNFSDAQRAAFRDEARALDGIDTAVYERFEKDPLEPIIGLGAPDTRVAFFGRDPGRDEVRHGMPFIGAGGQKVRETLHRYLYGREIPDFESSVAVGQRFFWANTVPYKPIGNKAWSMQVKKRFQPLMAEVLLRNWNGSDVIALGRDAFFWFGINQPKEVRAALEEFWERGDRYEAFLEMPLALADGAARTFKLYPLPHPSPLNATWYGRFPDLLTARLRWLDV